MATQTHRELLLTTLTHQADEVLGVAGTFPDGAVDRELKPGNWTFRHHLHHMRDTELRYLDRLVGVLRDGRYAPPPVQHGEPDPGEPISSMVEAYTTARAHEIEVLRGIDGAAWARAFTHPTIWGEVTVEWWAERMVQHTAEHLDELWMIRQLAGLAAPALERVQRSLFGD